MTHAIYNKQYTTQRLMDIIWALAVCSRGEGYIVQLIRVSLGIRATGNPDSYFSRGPRLLIANSLPSTHFKLYKMHPLSGVPNLFVLHPRYRVCSTEAETAAVRHVPRRGGKSTVRSLVLYCDLRGFACNLQGQILVTGNLRILQITTTQIKLPIAI